MSFLETSCGITAAHLHHNIIYLDLQLMDPINYHKGAGAFPPVQLDLLYGPRAITSLSSLANSRGLHLDPLQFSPQKTNNSKPNIELYFSYNVLEIRDLLPRFCLRCKLGTNLMHLGEKGEFGSLRLSMSCGVPAIPPSWQIRDIIIYFIEEIECFSRSH